MVGRGEYVEFLKFVEALDSACNEISILACHFDGIGSPIDMSADSTIPGNVLRQVDAVCEQEKSSKLQLGI